jgi:hypothetical protein
MLERLEKHLATLPQQQYSVRLTFQEIEKILNAQLPDAARNDNEWWCVEQQLKIWANAGFAIELITPDSIVLTRGIQK